MHTLLRLLPQVHTLPSGEIDPAATPQAVLKELSENAFDCAATLHRGVSAIGSLMAYAAPEVEDGTISSDTFALTASPTLTP